MDVPEARREAVAAMMEKVMLSERRACRLGGLSRSVLHDETKPNSNYEALSIRPVEWAHEHRCFGYRRLLANHKRVHRPRQEAGLAVSRRHGVMVQRERYWSVAIGLQEASQAPQRPGIPLACGICSKA